MILYRRLVSVCLSVVIYAASLFVYPDLLIHQNSCSQDFTIHAFDQLKFQGYLEKQVKSTSSASFQYSKSESWNTSFINNWRYQILLCLDVGLMQIFDDPVNIVSDITQILLFPFHSFW